MITKKRIVFPKISKEVYLFFYFLLFFFFFPLCICINNTNSLLLLSIIECFLFSVYLFKYAKTISFVFLFWVISHFFSLSILLIPKNNDFEALLPFTAHNLDEKYIFLTVVYTYLCNFLFSLGCIIANKCNINFVKNDYKKIPNIKKVIKILILIGVFPKLFLILKYFSLFLSGSYLSVIEYVPNGIFYFISTLTDVGLLLLISYDDKSRKTKFYMIVFILFQIFFAIVGKRGGAVSNIIALVVVLCSKVKIDIKKLFKICIVAFALLLVVVFISQYRGVSSDDRGSFFENFFGKSNIILYMLYFAFSEFGSAFLSAYYSIYYLGGHHNWGFNFFVSVFTIIPTTSSITHFVNENTVYKNLFPIKSNIGGSFVGEAFFSLSWLGVFLFILYGFFIGLISKLLIFEIRNKRITYSVFLIPMVSYLCWWIRDYFSPMVRPFVWHILLILLLSCFIKYLNGRKKAV